MTGSETGFHPIQRVVHRLAQISPHRQVQLLSAISPFATVLVIVASVFSTLTPTDRSLANSNKRLVPAIQRLDSARTSYNATSNALQRIVDADPNVRNTGISQLTALNSAGEAAWNSYMRVSAKLPGERRLQAAFVADRRSGLDAGGAFVLDPSPSTEGLAAVTRGAEALQIDLNKIKSLYEARVQRSLNEAAGQVDHTQREMMLISVGALIILLIAFGVAARSARTREERLEALDRALHDDSERNELEARLQRSFEMTHDEAAAYTLVGRALTLSVPDVPAELLVADSSRAHFRAAATAGVGGPGCPVLSPADCPAATWGQKQVWTSSTALDACPHLQSRPDGACSAVCVPVSIGGNTVGVVHAIGPDAEPPDDPAVVRVELIARKLGERVGMLRAFRRSETQAHTDPLTGLMNRRSIEEEVRKLAEDGTTYVAAYGDLDHFKQLNDVFGHDAGDQALRLFSRVLRDTVRPNDLVTRYGGEEFVIVLPECQISDAYAVINRVRERLAAAQAGSGSPPFTVSFGITGARPENTFGETLELADAALLKAKATGRDRIVISGSADQTTGPRSAPVSSDEPTSSATRS